MNEAIIFVFDAKVGMKLADDVILEDGSLLVKKDTVLDWNLISTISSHHILEIKIYDETKVANSEVPELKESEETIEYYDKVRKSEAFKHFEEDFVESVDDMKDELTSIVRDNKPINIDKLLHGPLKMLDANPNNFQLMDMVHSIRQYDDLTYVHSLNVSLFAATIARWLNYSEERVRFITFAGVVHDIGKLQIPKEILTKPGKLTDNEFVIMKKHVNLGFEALRNQDIDLRVKEAALLHHEKCDGSGYPFGLTSEKIPIEAKIVTVADVYDAMTANRVYRKAICPFEVVDIMNKDAFSKYDPGVAIPFLSHIVNSYIHNGVRLSDGRVGEVLLVHNDALSRPTVMVGKELVDLRKHHELSIVAIL